jgi:methionine-rich copper-binding protein CopC
MNLKRMLLTGAALTAFLAIGSSGAAAAFHFALKKSEPAADSTVPSPSHVRLYFTEAPEPGTVGIRLISPSGDPISTAEPAADEHDTSVFSVEVGRPLAPGAYTVSWRGLGDDGHAVRGDFKFAVSAE